MSEFEPGTYLGDNVKNIKNSGDTMVTGLPSSKYLMFGGMVMSPEVTTKVMDDFLAPVNKEIEALGADGKVMKDLHRLERTDSHQNTQEKKHTWHINPR